MAPMFIHTHLAIASCLWDDTSVAGNLESTDRGMILARWNWSHWWKLWIVFCGWNYPSFEDLVINPILFSIEARYGSEFPFSICCVPIVFSSQWRVATILSHSQAHKGLIIDAGQQAEWSQSGFISDLVETVYLLMLMEEWSLYWPFFFYLLTTLLSEMCAKGLSWTYFKGNFAGN